MEENNINSQLVNLDRTKMLEIIKTSSLTDSEKQVLSNQLLSNEVSVINNAMQKIADSGVAQHDIAYFLAELRQLEKKGMYATTKLEAKTGSGKIEMQFKGGDTKLIIPVLIIVAVVIIIALFIIIRH